MSDVVRCAVSGCNARYRRAGKHIYCPGHSPCYLAGHYDPFHAPCLPCARWLRGFANVRNPSKERLDCVLALRDWFRHILRRNRDQKIKVTACEDPVMLGILMGKKSVLPDHDPIIARLRPVLYPLPLL